MSDEFFDDEQELMHNAQAGAKPKRAKNNQAAGAAPAAAKQTARRDAPPFWMVLAIAVIALLLGVIIGYLIGTSTAYSALQVLESDEIQQEYGTGGGEDASSMLPEGHPEVSIDEDGNATIVDSGSSEAQ